jgi:circadian clock protein KaiC
VRVPRRWGSHYEEGLEKGLINNQQIDPAEMASGEFADAVRSSVESDNAQVVIIRQSQRLSQCDAG